MLATIMGQSSGVQDLSNHQLHKKRFDNGITNKTKKEMWKRVGEEYNSLTTTKRSADKIEKKWLNLSAKHRLLYADHKRNAALTGGGPAAKQLDLLTVQIMDVIGTQNVSVAGCGSQQFDVAAMKLVSTTDSASCSRSRKSPSSSCTMNEYDEVLDNNESQETTQDSEQLEILSVEDLIKRKLIAKIQYFESLERLKRKKYLAEIEYYEAKTKIINSSNK